MRANYGHKNDTTKRSKRIKRFVTLTLHSAYTAVVGYDVCVCVLAIAFHVFSYGFPCLLVPELVESCCSNVLEKWYESITRITDCGLNEGVWVRCGVKPPIRKDLFDGNSNDREITFSKRLLCN